MESDAPRRLHPASIFIDLLNDVRVFALPALLLMFGYASEEDSWRFWSGLLALPVAFGEVAKYFFFTYTYGRDELIIHSGVFFKKVRHIPYGRIQNIDASQGLLHRLFDVYTVTLQTGTGGEAEAQLEVLPESALNEMRRRVFADRRPARVEPAVEQEAGQIADAEPAPAAAPVRVLLELGLRDLALCGFIRGRGLLMLAAIFGLISQYDDKLFVDAGSPDKPTGGPVTRWLAAWFENPSFDIVQLLIWLVVFTLLVLLLRMLSVVRTMVTFHGFTLMLAGHELRLKFGLFTRVKATIPLGRIQTITIQEGPLHRLFGVSSMRVATAGGPGGPVTVSASRYLAPILNRDQVAPLMRVVMPEADIDGLTWEPAHPRAARRLFARKAIRVAIFSLLIMWFTRWWTAPLAIGLLAAAFASARLHAKHMGHSLSDRVFAYRSGWFMRQTTFTPLHKVQTVGVSESPFDRRHGMAGLTVDTAGMDAAPHPLVVPYLGQGQAHVLAGQVAAGAMESPLTW